MANLYRTGMAIFPGKWPTFPEFNMHFQNFVSDTQLILGAEIWPLKTLPNIAPSHNNPVPAYTIPFLVSRPDGATIQVNLFRKP